MSQDRPQPNNLGAQWAGFVKQDAVTSGHRRGDTVGMRRLTKPQPSTSRVAPRRLVAGLCQAGEENLVPTWPLLVVPSLGI